MAPINLLRVVNIPRQFTVFVYTRFLANYCVDGYSISAVKCFDIKVE